MMRIAIASPFFLMTNIVTMAGAQDAISGVGLSGLPLLTNAETRMVSPENPTGEKGKGAMAVPNANDPKLPFSDRATDLGQGWKVRPFIKVQSHETVTIMDVDGPANIQHIWIGGDWNGSGRGAVLRFYWDNEASPSIEVPLTDFFAVGNDQYAPVNSLAVVVNPKFALNCYWPMPFRKHAKITLANDTDQAFPLFTYQITYALMPVPESAGYFHAQWRRAVTSPSNPDYIILDGVKGQGRYVGTFLAWTQLGTGWFGEGEVKFYLDGDGKFPTIVGTGTEDYFGGTYGFPETFSTAYTGNTLKQKPTDDSYRMGPPRWSLYRWHLMDPINFQKDLRVTVQALGFRANRKWEPLMDDIASVAYWYQKEPHATFPKFPPMRQRWPR